MSFFTIFALIVLPILGGFIAWAGDIIGYRLGKSRRSLLGLRPRSTARLVAVVVGVVLPLATMVVAAAGSVEVRTALLHLTELQKSQTQLQSENAGLTQSLATSRQQKDAAEQEAAQARQRAAAARAQLAEAQTALTRAQTALADTQGKLRAAEDRRRQLDAQVRQLEGQVQQLGGQVKQLQGNLARTSAQLTAANQQLATARKALATAQQQEAAANKQVKALQDTEDRLVLEVDNAQRDLAKAQRDLKTTNDELEDKQERLRVAQEQLQAAGQTAYDVAAQGIATATGAVRYEPGTELMRTTIETAQTQAQIEATLHELELVASKKPEGLGVRVPEGGLAVRLITPVPPGTAPGELPNEDDLIKRVAAEIRASGAPQCVAVITVSLRSFFGDNRPVAADLSFRRNTLVYPRGAVIVHRLVDGSQPRAQVFEQLWGVQGGLLGDLRAASQQAGLMRDPQSGQYGEVPAEELLRALDELVASKQTQEVEAVATQEVWVANEPPFVVTLKLVPREQGGE
jgi:predicted  nucleic acid-binding Zn-ribbon protein